MKFNIKTSGMACEHCEKRLEGMLAKIDGVTECKADAKSGLVEVEATEKVTQDMLNECILDAGFEVEN